MLDEKYLLLEKERLLKKYGCQTIEEVLQILEKILENKRKKAESAGVTPQLA